MQQFTVPQFIDVENKIIGPITTRQFIIILAYVIYCALLYSVFDMALWLTCIIPMFFIAIFFAFIRINGRPSYYFVLNLLQTIKKPGRRVWNNKIRGFEFISEQDESKLLEKSVKAEEKDFSSVSRLTELSLIVDTQGAYRGETSREVKIDSIN